MSSDTPDFTAILDDLFIGNLAAAKTLHEHPELGITHVLSVCPEYPEAASAREGASAVSDASCPTVSHPAHRCVSVEDSEYEDILIHLPSAIAFIKDALESSGAPLLRGHFSGKNEGQQTESSGLCSKEEAELSSRVASAQKHKVLVHCVMGISRSTTVVCAYLMATRHLSFAAALMFIRTRRPRVHPNYGFRRQLQIFGDCGCFADYPAPIQTHPAYVTWQRKKKREITKYLSRLDDLVEIKLDDEKETDLSLTDDFPTDQLEASSLLSEIGTTHFLTISPASLPSSLTPPTSAAFRPRRPSGLLSPSMTPASGVATTPDSLNASPFSSRSSSFSNNSRLSSPVSSPSTAATSFLSLPSLLPPSKLRLEVSSSDSDEESENDNDNDSEIYGEPDYLALAGVEHHHIAVKDSDPSGLLLRLSEAVTFIQQALNDDDGSESDQDLNRNRKDRKDDRHRHVMIHCTTESRGCAIVCAYLMSCKGLTPSQAYSVLEKAQPLFNPTKSFVAQLELFYDCDCNPTLDHPRVLAWLSGEAKPAFSISNSSLSFGNSQTKTKTNHARPTTHWKIESDNESEDSVSLRRKLGTPMRCGSFSNAYLQQTNNNSKHGQTGSVGLGGNASRPSDHGPGGVDVEKLLQRFEGVGDPNFAFDVEAFRGALRGIAADKEKRCSRARGG